MDDWVSRACTRNTRYTVPRRWVPHSLDTQARCTKLMIAPLSIYQPLSTYQASPGGLTLTLTLALTLYLPTRHHLVDALQLPPLAPAGRGPQGNPNPNPDLPNPNSNPYPDPN